MADDVQVPIQAKIPVREIVKLEFELQNIIQEIRECDGPISVLNELNAKIKIKMNVLKGKVETLNQLANEQDKDDDSVAILSVMNKHKSEITSLQASIRKVNLACKTKIDQSERESLLSGRSTELRNRNFNKENLAATSSNITKDLMSCAKLMEGHVRQAENDLQNLATSSATVQETQEEYKGLSGIIHTSKNLLNKYNRREITDRLLIIFGLILFFTTVLYVIKKRVL